MKSFKQGELSPSVQRAVRQFLEVTTDLSSNVDNLSIVYESFVKSKHFAMLKGKDRKAFISELTAMQRLFNELRLEVMVEKELRKRPLI